MSEPCCFFFLRRSPSAHPHHPNALTPRDFRAKNPAVAQFDKFLTRQADPRAVSALFASKQLEHMRADRSEEDAYALARLWLVENGYEVLERMGIKLTDEEGEARRARLMAAHKRALMEEAERTRQALARAATRGLQSMPTEVRLSIEDRAVATPGASPQFQLKQRAAAPPPAYEPPVSDLESDAEPESAPR